MKFDLHSRQTCMDVCGMARPCGNTYCSANPQYVKPEERIDSREVAFRKRQGQALLRAKYLADRMRKKPETEDANASVLALLMSRMFR